MAAKFEEVTSGHKGESKQAKSNQSGNQKICTGIAKT
jgi:hypothetical protein